MDDLTKEDLEEALQAMVSMVNRTEKLNGKFAPGTSQHTLQKNRLKALHIASSLLSQKLMGNKSGEVCAQEDLKNALAPITSLISKSEKARTKLAPDTWQHKMLSDNLKALHMALLLLRHALNEGNDQIS